VGFAPLGGVACLPAYFELGDLKAFTASIHIEHAIPVHSNLRSGDVFLMRPDRSHASRARHHFLPFFVSGREVSLTVPVNSADLGLDLILRLKPGQLRDPEHRNHTLSLLDYFARRSVTVPLVLHI